MKCHEVDYEIMGDDMQVVEVELDPQETVIAEAGAMNYLQPEVTFETKMGDGSRPEKGLVVDVVTGKAVNMIDNGIIDPVLVTKSALKNAVSVVTTIISADCVISNMRMNESNQ